MTTREVVRPVRIVILISACLAAIALSASGQTPLENAVQQFSSQNVRGYVQPLADGAGANFNSGLYHSADLGEDGFTLDLQVVSSGMIVRDGDKKFMATPPSGYSQNPVETATIFGGSGTIVNGPAPGLQYQFQNGQLKTPILLYAVPQLTIGTFFGTQAVIRYVPLPQIGNIPKSTLVGGGIRHSISRYLPELPLDLAAGAFYQELSIGTIMKARGFLAGVQASKSFPVVSLYGGAQYQTSNFTLDYLYTGPGSTPNTKIHLDLAGRNYVSGTIGLNFNLIVLNLNADASFGLVTIVSAGLGFGL